MLGEQARLAVRWRDSRRRKSSCALNVSLLQINNLGFPVLKNLRLSWECHWCYLKIKMNYLYFCNFRKCPTTRSQWPGWAEQSEELQARALCRTGGAEAQLPAASRLYKSGKLELETELGHEPSVWPSQSRALTIRPRTHADFWKSSSCISNFCPVLVFNNIFYFKGESKGGHCGPAHWATFETPAPCMSALSDFEFDFWSSFLLIQLEEQQITMCWQGKLSRVARCWFRPYPGLAAWGHLMSEPADRECLCLPLSGTLPSKERKPFLKKWIQVVLFESFKSSWGIFRSNSLPNFWLS